MFLSPFSSMKSYTEFPGLSFETGSLFREHELSAQPGRIGLMPGGIP
jgi:hypothetical protein